LSSELTAPPALPCAVFLVIALALAGGVHVAWLRSAWSRPFALPIDAGRLFRGVRVFGANKTYRGLMAMPAAAATVFAAFSSLRGALPAWLESGVWAVPAATLAMAGFVSGLAFMLAELPNSFFKRQMNIEPGGTPRTPLLRCVCFVIDRIDSTLGALLGLSLMLPMRPMTWIWCLLIGAGTHWLFSYWLYLLKLKARPS
jgi:CDP-archaeol synthase